MAGRIRVPMIVIVSALVGLIVLLATLQYSWLGRISDAERQRMRASLDSRAAEFVKDFDQEITRAYLLFQPDPVRHADDEAEGLALRHDRWQATARFPRLLKSVYRVTRADDGTLHLFELDVAARRLLPAEWPESMAGWREQFGDRIEASSRGTVFFRRTPPAVWDSVPAIVVPTPVVMVYESSMKPDVRVPSRSTLPTAGPTFRSGASQEYTLLALDRDYVTSDLLPALATQHFRAAGDRIDYQVAVVAADHGRVLYHSTAEFSPKPDAPVDTTVEFFQVRTQDFGALASEVRRYTTTFTTAPLNGTPPGAGRGGAAGPPHDGQRGAVVEGRFEVRTPMSIVVQQTAPGAAAATAAGAAALTTATTRMQASVSPRWKLMVKHPSGSLEAAVASARRRNLFVSTTILAVLGASVGLLVLSTRRAQELARQQMEFVAAVSHELRTPLAVIRSAAENLADGVVKDDAQIRKYGDLVRNEGRRLTEMVEQILELAGIHSGQRGFALGPVGVRPLLHDIVDRLGSLLEEAGIEVEFEIADGLPPVFGDEPALQRVFQNLVGNAIKYGASGRWIGIRATSVGREIHVAIADRGIGIPPAEQARIFEPFYRAADVVAAQIQGAGLGLSLVKRIVEAHGGRISVKSAPGAGSEFTVVLPAAIEARAQTADAARARAAAPQRS